MKIILLHACVIGINNNSKLKKYPLHFSLNIYKVYQVRGVHAIDIRNSTKFVFVVIS